MFIHEAVALLKDVVCPHCKNQVLLSRRCPFVLFNPTELNDNCDTKDCIKFYEEMQAHFNSYDKGQIGLPELHSWLGNFREENNME
jgi:hypothetical protein